MSKQSFEQLPEELSKQLFEVPKPTQYLSDEIIGGTPKGSGRKKANDPNGAASLLIGHTVEGLFDESDKGAELDDATGHPHDTATFTDLEEPHDPQEHRFGKLDTTMRRDINTDIYPPEQRDAIDAWIDAEEKKQQALQSGSDSQSTAA